MFTPETLLILAEVLGGVQMQVGHPEFEDKAVALAQAKRELGAALAEADAEAELAVAANGTD